MMNNFIYSTVFKIAALMFMVSFLAILSMFSSMFVSDGAQQDAQAINIAGSLRMQSYRLTSKVQAVKLSGVADPNIHMLAQQFEKDLMGGVLISQRAVIKSNVLDQMHQKIQSNWFEVIKPMLITGLSTEKLNANTLNNITQRFVEDVDKLVAMHQQQAEDNISTIRLIQSVALFTTLILVAFAMFIVNRHIKQPLSNLTHIARQIGRGDFTVRANETGKDELALLARTINKMSDSIYRSQSQLEEHVKRKTKKLSQSIESLNLLFEISRQLNGLNPNQVDYSLILNQLSAVTNIKDLDLCLMTAEGNGPYEHLITTEKNMPDNCINSACNDCTSHDKSIKILNKIRYQLTHNKENYGVLLVNMSDDRVIDEWQHQLFESVAEQLATNLSMKHQQEQNRRIALMTERTVIARELHDSLAQALSYLKIQVTRLQRLQQQDDVQDKIDQVIDELKNGLSSAYRELRELLTTFRLKLDNQTFREAFEQCIEQLKSRSDKFTFNLDYQVGHIPFSPQEEIHLLQIAREATQNAFYHSKGNKIDIGMTVDASSLVTLSITDNGVGLPNDPSKLNHYGLAIMQERSRSLNGTIKIEKRASGGTQVFFTFTPDYFLKSDIVVKAI